MDQHGMASLWKAHRTLKTDRLWIEVSGGWTEPSPITPYDSYNSIQMEKLWRFAQGNILDRERVVMTNVSQAIEHCLKAVMTHARFRHTKEFSFDEGHDISRLYEALPNSLRNEIVEESDVFVENYRAFRDQVQEEIERLQGGWIKRLVRKATAQEERRHWERIFQEIG